MSTTVAKPRSSRPTSEDDITAEVLRRVEATPDPRTREIMLSLIKHVHAFIKDVRLTEAEWWKGIEFLTRTGHMCDDRRQEFILLSDTLGVSMVTDLMSNRKPAGATESTVFGPFHREAINCVANRTHGNIRDQCFPKFVWRKRNKAFCIW